jgi:hypothetical protein
MSDLQMSFRVLARSGGYFEMNRAGRGARESEVRRLSSSLISAIAAIHPSDTCAWGNCD